MSESDHGVVIWVSSSTEQSSASDYATCAEDSIDLEISDRDDITHLIRALAIAEDHAENEAERARAAADETSYRIGSATTGTATAHWAMAGTAQIEGAHVAAERKRHKKRPKRYPFYVVFIGRPSGVHIGWPAAKAATSKVSGNCFKGYATLAEAHAAWAYAEERGWVGDADGRRPNPLVHPIPIAPHGLGAPALTPLCPSDQYRRYYCVFRGQRPGIYGSIIETNLSAVGVPTGLHESVSSVTVARDKYQVAVENNKIEIIAMP